MEISDRAKGEGLQIPLLNAAGLQIRPNGYSQPLYPDWLSVYLMLSIR